MKLTSKSDMYKVSHVFLMQWEKCSSSIFQEVPNQRESNLWLIKVKRMYNVQLYQKL